MIRWLRALWIAARFIPTHKGVKWGNEDAHALTKFLGSHSGAKFKATLRNMVITAQSSAVVNTNTLQHACGYANGFVGAISAIESLATLSFSEEEQTTDSLSELDYQNP